MRRDRWNPTKTKVYTKLHHSLADTANCKLPFLFYQSFLKAVFNVPEFLYKLQSLRTVQTGTQYFCYMHILAMVITEQIVLEMMQVPHKGQLQVRKPAGWTFSIKLFVLIHTVKAIRTKGAPSQDLPQVEVKIIDDNSQIIELLLAKCKWTMLIILEHGNTERRVLQTFQERKTSEKEIFLYEAA